jgi:hypothetical protein
VNNGEPPILVDDPELRAAIRRVQGGHVAEAALRDRIERSLRSGPTPPSRSAWVWPVRIAIAACLMLAGVVGEHVRHKAEERSEYVAQNQPLFVAMVAEHAQPLAATAASDPVAVQRDLAKQLSRSVPLPDLSAMSWTLQSSAVRTLSGAVAGRCDFSRADGRRATLLTFPQFAMRGADDGFTYDTVVAGHPISGYVTADGVHCVVGDAGMPPAEITSLRQRLQAHANAG